MRKRQTSINREEGGKEDNKKDRKRIKRKRQNFPRWDEKAFLQTQEKNLNKSLAKWQMEETKIDTEKCIRKREMILVS